MALQWQWQWLLCFFKDPSHNYCIPLEQHKLPLPFCYKSIIEHSLSITCYFNIMQTWKIWICRNDCTPDKDICHHNDLHNIALSFIGYVFLHITIGGKNSCMKHFVTLFQLIICTMAWLGTNSYINNLRHSAAVKYCGQMPKVQQP